MRVAVCALWLVGCVTLEDYVAGKQPPSPVTDTVAETPTPTPEDTVPGIDTDDTVDTELDTDFVAIEFDLILVEVAASAEWTYVQVYNPGTVPLSLSDYRIGLFNQGLFPPNPASATYTFPNRNLAGESSFVVAFSGTQEGFESAFEQEADDYSPVFDGNGDQIVLLYKGGPVVDAYGAPGTTTWDYQNRVARRTTSVQLGEAVWDTKQWTVVFTTGASPFEH